MTDPQTRRRNRANKRRGATYEVALVKWFREHGWEAERISKRGRGDEGDVAVTIDRGEYLLIEAKDEQRHNFSGYLHEAEHEASYFASNRKATAHPVAVVKRRQSNIDQSYVVMTLDAFERLVGA